MKIESVKVLSGYKYSSSLKMNIDGVNGLACIKSHSDINGDLNISPLPHLKVVKDLMIQFIAS